MDSRRNQLIGGGSNEYHNLILARIKLFFGLKIAVCYIDVFTKYGDCGDGKILPRLGKRELICLLLFTCNYVVSV